MALETGSLVEITMTMVLGGQKCLNVWQYALNDFSGIPTAGDIGEAWWNHVESAYRACVVGNFGQTFTSVKVVELGFPEGEYGEFAVPILESAGTRTGSNLGELLPTFNAVGVRLAVGSRVTRPGQKRFPFIMESDSTFNTLEPGLVALVDALMVVMETEMLLGAPAVGITLQPVVVAKGALGTITAFQGITGHATNGYATSQVSRKQGRGI